MGPEIPTYFNDTAALEAFAKVCFKIIIIIINYHASDDK